MSKTPLLDVAIYYGGLDIAGVTNSLDLGVTAEAKDCTTYASGGWKESIASLLSGPWSFKGYHDPTAGLDAAAFAGGEVLVSAFPARPPAAGQVGWARLMERSSYSLSGSVGDLIGYDLSLEGRSPSVRGQLLQGGVVAATGAAPDIQLPSSVLAGHSLYLGLQVLAVTGTSPTLTTQVESDGDDSFSSPVVRASFSEETDVSAHWQWVRVPGPITDTYLRAVHTVSAGATFDVRLFAGIG